MADIPYIYKQNFVCLERMEAEALFLQFFSRVFLLLRQVEKHANSENSHIN